MSADKIEPVHVLPLSDFKSRESDANKVADFLATNEDLISSIKHGIKTKDEDIISVASIHFDLFETEGLSEDFINGWPDVGSIEGHTGNRPYDIFWFKNANGVKEQASFFRMMSSRFPVGAEILKRKRALVEAQVGKDETGLYKSQKKAVDDEFTTYFGKFKTAIMLYQKMARANAELGKFLNVSYAEKARTDVNGAPITGEDGQVEMEIARRAKDLIYIKDKTRKDAGVYFTIHGFIRLDVDVALKKGGTFGDFIKSAKREKTGPENDDIVQEIRIENNDGFEDVSLKMLHHINAAKYNPAKLRDLVAFYSEVGSDDRLITLDALKDAIDVILGMKSVKDRLDAMKMGTTQAPTTKQKAA